MVSFSSRKRHNDANVESLQDPPKKGKAGRHCKRWWWAWLLGFGILVMVVMLIVVYGVLPKIGQDKIDETELQLNSLKIMDPTPGSFKVSMDATIATGGGAASHADLDAMTIELFLGSERGDQNSFMSMPLDKLKGSDNINVVKNDVDVQITAENELKDFARALMANKTLSFSIHGRTKLWLGKLNAKVNYDEVVTMNGLNHLEGMAIKEYKVVTGSKTENLEGRVLIPNPSIVTIQMGDVQLNIGLGGKSVGTGWIPGLLLTPGDNLYDFNALVDKSEILNVAMAAGVTPLDISSNGTFIGGEKIGWLSAPLETLETKVPIDTEH